MHAYNCDEWMNAYCRFFYAAEISEVDVILNYPWLYAVNSGIDWKKQVWQYPINFRQISIVSLKKFVLEMKEVRQIFTVMLSFFMKADQFTQVMLLRELTNFQNVIIIRKKSMLPLYKSAVHYIDIKNQKVLYRPFYNLSSYKLKVLHEYLNDALVKGWIQHSVSPAESLVLFIPKKNGSLWLCVDYQGLNKKTIKNCHSLPLIDEILDHLMRFYYFTKLNLKDVYH